MRRVLLGFAAPLAAIAVFAAPAEAEHWSAPGFTAAAGVAVHRGSDAFPDFRSGDRPFADPFVRRFDCRRDDDDHDDDHRRRARDCVFVGGPWGYTQDYDANRSFDADRWNDWWHERPHRAFPRWVREQRGAGCDPERMWWSGRGWRC